MSGTEENTIIACRPNKEISLLIKEIELLRKCQSTTTQNVIDAFEWCDKNVVDFKNQGFNYPLKSDIMEDEIKYIQLHIPTLVVDKIRAKIKNDYNLSVVQQRFMLKLVLEFFLEHLYNDSKNSIKLISWNINQSCLLKDKSHKISKDVLEKVADSDIFVLLEVFNLKNHIDEYRRQLWEFELYYLNVEPVNMQNEVLIGVKKNKKLMAPSFEEFLKQEQLPISKEYPNTLSVNLKTNRGGLDIVGVRIPTGKGDRKDYIERAQQLCNLLNYFSKAERAIIMGDFNNAGIKGDFRKSYYEVREEYHFTNKGEISDLYDTYNYHIMRDISSARGFNITGLPQNHSHIVYGFKYKLDHLLSKGIAPIQYGYNWEFMENNSTYKGFTHDDCLSSLFKTGTPDHAMLTAEIRFEDL
ncbi:MAG: hypothetical protein RR253_03940 [Oscillospiraceae bacterium]